MLCKDTTTSISELKEKTFNKNGPGGCGNTNQGLNIHIRPDVEYAMSKEILPKVEDQIQEYFLHPDTQVMNESTKKGLKDILYGKLLTFCNNKGVDNLNVSFRDYMDEYAEFINEDKCPIVTEIYLIITKFLFRFHGIEISHTYIVE